MALEVYSSRDVQVAWAGIAFSGFASDSFVGIEPNADLTDEEVGADGQLATSINPDRTGTVTIALQQNSQTNLVLSGVLHDQMYKGRKFRKGDLTVADPSGSVLAYLKGAYIKTRPSISLGSTSTGNSYTWTFFCEEMIYTPAPPGISKAVADSAALEVKAAISKLDSLLRR